MSEVQFLERLGQPRLAYRSTSGEGTALVFLPGYMSDMEGGKATALFDRARETGRPALLLDYSGCGQSGGDFADGTLDLWRDEVLALIDHVFPDRPIILVGSSMGGWLMLLVALSLPERVEALVGIAAAPDFTRWGFDEAQRTKLAAGETIFEDNPYGPEPTPTHAAFWRSGEANLLLDGEIALDCPVRLLHGQCDPDVPWEISLKLAAALRSSDVQTLLIKDGDHRLSRDADISRIVATVDDLFS